MRKLSVVAGAVLLAVWGCDAKKDSDDGPNNGSSEDGGPSGDSGTTPDGGSSSNDSGSTDNPGTPATSCSTATLLAGNPAYDGDFQGSPASGTAIREGKPLYWHELVFDGKKLYSRSVDGEVWMTDLSATKPVETLLAGKDDPTTYDFKDGACASARFAQIRGMQKLKDGSLVVADSLGNGILHVKDPAGAGCTVEFWAGNHTPGTDLDPSADRPNHGDTPGAGNVAQFDSPAALDVDAADNIYVWDSGNKKIKKIANDAAHTVSDLAPVDADRIFALTHIGNTLYFSGQKGSDNVVFKLDMAGGTVGDVVRSDGGTKFEPYDLHQGNAIATGLTTDGTGLIVQGLGYVWYVTTAGVVTNIAGSGEYFTQPSGYDPAASLPASAVALLTDQGSYNSGSITYVTYHDGAVYFRGRNLDSGPFVERIACP